MSVLQPTVTAPMLAAVLAPRQDDPATVREFRDATIEYLAALDRTIAAAEQHLRDLRSVRREGFRLRLAADLVVARIERRHG